MRDGGGIEPMMAETCAAKSKSFMSAPGLSSISSPIGKPWDESPIGMVMPGSAAQLDGNTFLARLIEDTVRPAMVTSSPVSSG